jgi:hypothetical protein
MRSWMRAVLVAALSLVALAGASSAASALTVSPTGNYTFTAQGATDLALGSLGAGGVLECQSSIAGGTVGSDGRGSLSSVVYNDCDNGVLGEFLVIQSVSPWLALVILLSVGGRPAGIALLVEVPTEGATIYSHELGCSFTVSGWVVFLLAISALPHTITTGLVIPAIDSELIVDSSEGICQLFIPEGLRGIYTGSYSISRSATVSG